MLFWNDEGAQEYVKKGDERKNVGTVTVEMFSKVVGAWSGATATA